MSTTGGSDLAYINYVGQVSTILHLLTSKDSDLSSYFDKIGESGLNDNNLLKRILINNHTDVNKAKYRRELALEHIFGFCKTFKKITKILGFHLKVKTAKLQDSILNNNSY